MSKNHVVIVFAFFMFFASHRHSLAQDPSPEVAKLVKDLKSSDPVVRLQAAKELGQLKEKA